MMKGTFSMLSSTQMLTVRRGVVFLFFLLIVVIIIYCILQSILNKKN
jgi:uncharacterized protein YqhQ